MGDFIGRDKEFKQLERLRQKKTSSLVCILGRRRIGKSTLIEKFGKSFKNTFFIQGLAPNEKSDKRSQLDHLFQAMVKKFGKRNIDQDQFQDWSSALNELALQVKKDEWLILLDEISWLGGSDPLFSSKLKDAWDMSFKSNPKLIFVVCGSVSSWIDENIIQNTNFEGRLSLQMNLNELDLHDSNLFWKRSKGKVSAFEKMKILSVTGGVPKYLEEVLLSETVEKNLVHLCFNKSGLLFNEFDIIFTDVFHRRARTYEAIVRCCLEGRKTAAQISNELGISQNKELTNKLHHLVLAGFLSRDYLYSPIDGHELKHSYYRLKDNYLRFYLKIIEHEKSKILSGAKEVISFNSIKNYDALLGYQFENLMLSNRHLILNKLDIALDLVISASPYIQSKTTTTDGCQIDLFIHTKLDVFFLCEFKCKKEIDKSIVKEVEEKINKIKIPKRTSIKPVLIYVGDMYGSTKEIVEDYFYKTISLDDLLTL